MATFSYDVNVTPSVENIFFATYANPAVKLKKFQYIRHDDNFCPGRGRINRGFQSSQPSLAQLETRTDTGGDIPDDRRGSRSCHSDWTYHHASTISTLSIDHAHHHCANGRVRPRQPTLPRRVTYSWGNISVVTSGAKASVGCKSIFNLVCPIDVNKGEGKQLLQNVNGAISSGELVCILGASGAGKTTLLNTLTFRNATDLKVTGQRYINGDLVNARQLATVSAYIQQQDLFVGTLTVKEHLWFHAMLRMHQNIPYAERMEKIEKVIDEFGLRKCVNTRIGIPGRIQGLSGGEQKRLSLASEILTDPIILFCDEPNSGLDSYMAQTIMQCLKAQAQKGKAILCTIHQPSSSLFQLFDKVLVMAEGRVAYFGLTTDVLRFLEWEGFPCPQNYNPAEFITDTLAIHPECERETRATVNAICDGFEKTQAYALLQDVIVQNSEPPRFRDSSFGAAGAGGGVPVRLGDGEAASRHYKASIWTQSRALLWRSCNSYVKNPFVLTLRFIEAFAVALVMGSFCYNEHVTQDTVGNINGALFMFVIAVSYQSVLGSVDAFCNEAPVFLRENWNAMYRTDIYYLSKVCVDLPFSIIFSFILVSITYWLLGILENTTLENFLYAVGIVVLVSNISSAFGYFLSCLANTVTMALVLMPVFIFPGIMFGGLFLNSVTVPWYLTIIQYLSWFYYGFKGLLIVQWEGVGDIPCNSAGFSSSNESATMCPTSMTGNMVLDSMGFSQENLTHDLIALGSLMLGFQVLAFVSLLVKTYRRN